MMKQSIVFLALILSNIGFAQAENTGHNTGIVPPYILEAIENAKASAIRCEDEQFLFDSYESTLTVEGRVIALRCEAVVQDETHPDQPLNLMNCVEDRAGDGRYSVSVNSFGIIPGAAAKVSIGQMFPLKAKTLGYLGCQK